MAKLRRILKTELTVSCESNSRSKNYVGVILSVVVLLLISSMIVAAIVIINPEITDFPPKVHPPREAITLDEALLGFLSPNEFSSQWLKSPRKDGADELLFEDMMNIITVQMPPAEPANASSLFYSKLKQTSSRPVPPTLQPNVRTLVSNTSYLASNGYQGYKISPSEKYLLIWTKRRRQFRHTYTARFFIYDIENDLISMLSTQQSNYQTSPLALETLPKQKPLSSGALPVEEDLEDEFSRFQLVSWFSRTDDKGELVDGLLMVQNNDVYVLSELNSGGGHVSNQTATVPRRLTFTGRANEIFNAVPDWLYEEEILGDTPAFQVARSGHRLAYMSFNDSQVGLMPFTIYGNSDQVVPKIQRIRYPKTGRVNPLVSVHVIDSLHDNHISDIQLSLPTDLSSQQHYINRIQWLTDEELALVWLNRNQNNSFILICSRQHGWRCEKNLHMSSPGGWLDLSDDLVPLDNKHYLAIVLKHEGEDVGSFKHIAKISIDNPNTSEFLTSGRKEVLSIKGVDKQRSLVYYMSTVEGDPGQRQLYSASLSGPPKDDRCITCGHYPQECLYNYVDMSHSTNYYIFQCAGPGIPRTELRVTPSGLGLTKPSFVPPTSARAVSDGRTASMEESSGDSSLLWVIESNQELSNALFEAKVMPSTMRLEVPLAGTNYSARVLLLLPPQLGQLTTFKASLSSDHTNTVAEQSVRPRRNAASRHLDGTERPFYAHYTLDSIKEYIDQLTVGQKYPMVVDVYAGPGSQKVDYRFHVYFGHYLASRRRTVYAMIDGRGSGYQGTKRLYELYRAFGTVEIQDQINVADHLAKTLSFIDRQKVGIWGWSYGGYASAMALAQSNAQALLSLENQLRQVNLLNNQTSAPVSLSNILMRHQNSKHERVSSSMPPVPSLQGVFECAASVAPVTNWIYYDTAYTERYMSSPYIGGAYDELVDGDHLLDEPTSNLLSTMQNFNRINEGQSLDSSLRNSTNKWIHLNSTSHVDFTAQPVVVGSKLKQNPNITWSSQSLNLNDHYIRASLIDQIGNIDRKRFILIHGTADDNVHFQQSIMLMKSLIHRNVMFESRLYPDQDHGIANRADKLHLGATLSNFFSECFDMNY